MISLYKFLATVISLDFIFFSFWLIILIFKAITNEQRRTNREDDLFFRSIQFFFFLFIFFSLLCFSLAQTLWHFFPSLSKKYSICFISKTVMQKIGKNLLKIFLLYEFIRHFFPLFFFLLFSSHGKKRKNLKNYFFLSKREKQTKKYRRKFFLKEILYGKIF